MLKTLLPETESPASLRDLVFEKLQTSDDAISAEQDPLYLVENEKLKIKTKPGELIPLKLNPIQKKVLKKIKELDAQGKPIRIWILKARQEGVSTLVEAIIYAFTSQRQNINSLIIADDIDGANYLFTMSKIYHDEIEPDLQHELKLSNQKKLEFAERYSQILIDTADNTDAGRKYTFQYVHLSEVAFYRNAKMLMLGLNQAVPELPGTMIIGETTANGVGGYFFEQWNKAKKGETDWIPIFLAWFENPEYIAPVPKDFVLTKEEVLMKERYQLEDNQLQWRRLCIKNKCDGDPGLFNQEYPSNDIDAFIVSGNCRFNTQCLKKMQTISINEGTKGRLLDVHKNIVYDQDSGSQLLRIWKRPLRRELFIIGSDVAEGLEKGDYSTAEVLNALTLEQVAEMRCHLEPDVFALELARLGKFYHTALIGVERNNHGIAVLQEIRKIYSNLYYMETFAEETQVRTKKLGWLTTSASKPMMIAETDKVIREATGLIHSPELLSELMTYIRLPDGKTEAQEGCFDDLVIAYSIALQMRKYAKVETRMESDDDSFASEEFERLATKRRGY